MGPATYLVFGDLHGRVLPAFKLAQAWSREHGVALAGLLQVGDLGYFPEPSRFDKATQRHAEKVGFRNFLQAASHLPRFPFEQAPPDLRRLASLDEVDVMANLAPRA